MKRFNIFLALLFSINVFAPQTFAQKAKVPPGKIMHLTLRIFQKNLTDSALLDSIEHRTFQYFWKGAEPNSGMAPERIHMDNDYPDKDPRIIATGGSGFGIMAILAGIERSLYYETKGLQRFEKIVSFLEKADRFHGAWPHWINGENGHVKPFGQKDNGGDLVETSFLLQGLLCVRQYFKDGNEQEKNLHHVLISFGRN